MEMFYIIGSETARDTAVIIVIIITTIKIIVYNIIVTIK